MYKINLTCVFSLLRRTVYIGFTPFRIFRYLSQKCIPNQNQYGFCTKQEVAVFHGKIAWKPYHTKKNSRLCSIYYTINWNFIICAAIVSWKTWLPLLILNNFFLFLISKFWRPQTTQCEWMFTSFSPMIDDVPMIWSQRQCSAQLRMKVNMITLYPPSLHQPAQHNYKLPIETIYY